MVKCLDLTDTKIPAIMVTKPFCDSNMSLKKSQT